jgi:hypothetical protein
MNGYSINDRVRLLAKTERYEWTEPLVGHEGTVTELKSNAVAVEGLTPGEPLWFSLTQLEAVENDETEETGDDDD